MVFGSDSIQVYTNQRLKQNSIPLVDSTQVKKPTAQKQPISIHTEKKPVSNPTTTLNANVNQPAVAPKPKPKPPVKTELSATSTNSKNDAGSLVGSFDTNLPSFKELNMQNKKAIADAGGVGVYGEGEVKVTHHDGPPPTESVTFPGKNVGVSFPTPEPPVKGSIVYDAETKTYAFNNINGLKLTSKPHEGEGGEKFLISGGTVDVIDTGENFKKDSENLPNYDTKPQTIVLMNTFVKDGAITVANDRIVANKNTQMNADTIHTIAKNAKNDRYKASFLAYEGHNDVKNTSKLQSGYSMSSVYTNWLGGNEKDLKSLRTTETLGTVNIDNNAFSAVNTIKDKAPARTIGNINVYTTTGHGDDLKVVEQDNGNTRITLPKDQVKGAQIYYDRTTNTLYMENLNGVRMNGEKSPGHYDMKVNLAIKDCHFNYLNTMETTTSEGKRIANATTGMNEHSNIAILGKSKVDQLFSTYDDIFLDNDSSVGTYAGIGNETTENLTQQNKVVRENRHFMTENGKVYYKADLNGLPKEVRDAYSSGQTYDKK